MSNGIIFDLEDRMVVAEGADFGGRRITRTDLSTGKSEIVAAYGTNAERVRVARSIRRKTGMPSTSIIVTMGL